MAQSTQPTFANVIATATTTISTANTLLDGNGTMSTLITGKQDGTEVLVVKCKAQGTTTNGMIRMFYDDGTTVRLLDELDVIATTPSATTKAWDGSFSLGVGFALPHLHSLKFSTEKAESFTVIALRARAHSEVA